MKRFVYRDKKTGKRVFSDVRLSGKGFVLISEVRDGQMKGANIRTS